VHHRLTTQRVASKKVNRKTDIAYDYDFNQTRKNDLVVTKPHVKVASSVGEPKSYAEQGVHLNEKTPQAIYIPAGHTRVASECLGKVQTTQE